VAFQQPVGENRWLARSSEGKLMSMARKFKTVDYEAALHQTVTVEECLS
jgi:hypothetical protein